MTDPFGKFMIRFIERRMAKLYGDHKMMRIVGKRFTIWVTERIEHDG
jgi:hypothetical protein